MCLTLCDPINCSSPGSSVHGILQARILEWDDISFSRGSSWPRDWTLISCVVGRLFSVWATRDARGLQRARQDWHSFSGLPGRLSGKEFAHQVGDVGLIPGSGRSPGKGNDNPLQDLPGKFHEQRSLGDYSPWGHKKVRHDLITKKQIYIFQIYIFALFFQDIEWLKILTEK